MSDKIINTFQQRRQLAQAISDLAGTESELEMVEIVRGLVSAYPPDLLIQTLVKHLDTPSSQLRGGLGHLAGMLPPEEVVPALRSAAANRQNSAQTRITAALILERFLGETVPAGLLSDLNNSNEVAFQSLREAVEEGRRHRHILLEYVSQMRQTGQEIAYMVMDLLERLPEADRPELLRLIALDDRPLVAKEALARLERLALRGSETGDESASNEPNGALRALHALVPTLPPDEAAQAQRSLRKLQFAGKRYTPPAAEGWRALIGPSDIAGNQQVWLVRMPSPGKSDGLLVGLVLSGYFGLIDAFGAEQMTTDLLPGRQRVGQMVLVKTDNGETLVFLEAPFDYGRWRVQEALAAHWQQQPPRFLPGEYRLYSDLIWQFDAPVVDPALRRYFERGAQNTPSDELPKLDPEQLARMTERLFEHPAMSGWTMHSRVLVQVAEPDLSPGGDPDAFTAMVLAELEKRPEGAQLADSLQIGLRTQAAWLHLAGFIEGAEIAYTLAEQMAHLPISQNTVLAYMIDASLRAHRSSNSK